MLFVVALLLVPPISFREPALQANGQIAVSRLVAPPVRHKRADSIETVTAGSFRPAGVPLAKITVPASLGFDGPAGDVRFDVPSSAGRTMRLERPTLERPTAVLAPVIKSVIEPAPERAVAPPPRRRETAPTPDVASYP